ncbi:MAG: hypothetical protein LBK57_03945 [Clostridiales Family XIII bacterium]|jgi:hypothetical protein|nr:hypothetical protein [Clostridiales Family XIII bacterium]
MIIQSRAKVFIKIILPIVLFLIVLSLFVIAVSKIAGKSENEGIHLTAESIKRAAVQCYALEGVYPADFDYLKDHYAVRPDENKYIIYYTYTASNLMPEIDVLSANAETVPDPTDVPDEMTADMPGGEESEETADGVGFE